MLMCLKNSNINLIDSIVIDYGNNNVVQQSSRINNYLNFKLHSEMSYDDELLNGATIGYSKDSATSWQYYNDVSPYGTGICNNVNVSTQFGSSELRANGNLGMYNRQNVFQKMNQQGATNGKEHVYGSYDKVKSSGMNYISDTTTHKAYYYECIIRLKDLLFFEKLPLLKGANIRFTMVINQTHFQVEKDAIGLLSFKSASYIGGNTNPIMMSASHSESSAGVGADAADTSTATQTIACGSQTLPCNAKYTFTCSVAKNHFTNNGALEHERKSVRLYVPSYIMQPSYELKYLAQAQKKITYTDIVAFPKLNVSDEFNFLVTNGLARMKRLICVPVVASTANGSAADKFSPCISPFTTEPSTCSPYLIQNFNIQLGGLNLYQNGRNYNYETYLDEMSGRYGIESNLTTGLCSSRISLNDYNNNYGYLVADLSRRSPEDNTVPISLQVSGKVTSLLPLDLFFYCEVEKTITLDLHTGQMIN
jgi:hypothetical protein